MDRLKQLFYPKDENIVLSDLEIEGGCPELRDAMLSLWQKDIVFAYWDNKVNKVLWILDKDLEMLEEGEVVQPLKPNTCNKCEKEIDPLFDELISGLCDACRSK